MSTTSALLPGLRHLGEVDKSRYQYQIERKNHSPHTGLHAGFAFNVFLYVSMDTKKSQDMSVWLSGGAEDDLYGIIFIYLFI